MRIFVLLLLLPVKDVALNSLLQLGPQMLRIFNLGNTMKVASIGDAQTTHAVHMLGFLEVLLKVVPAAVGFVAADLARVKVIESVELEQPVWDGLAVPPERYALGVVDGRVFLVAVVIAVTVLSVGLVLTVLGFLSPHSGDAIDLLVKLVLSLIGCLVQLALGTADGGVESRAELVEERLGRYLKSGDVNSSRRSGKRRRREDRRCRGCGSLGTAAVALGLCFAVGNSCRRWRAASLGPYLLGKIR